MMTPDDFRFLEPLRVRRAEVDMKHVVFNAHYLAYVDAAFIGYWRALALPYEPALAALGGELYLRRATLDWHAPARHDDALAVGIRFDGVGTSSLRFCAGIFRGDELLAQAELVHVWTAASTRRPCAVPAALAEAFRAHAGGAAMVDVEVGDWLTLGAQARALRTAVFVDEQKIPATLEMDSADAGALHAVARNRLGQALATGRLLAGALARIGRMAVRRDLRGTGVGRRVLEALMAAAGQRGDAEVMLHAQAGAVEFYRRAAFVPYGEPFVEAGIVHQKMRRTT